LKKLLKDKAISEDDEKRHAGEVQKATDQAIIEVDQVLAMSDMAAVIRAHPEYRAPSAMIAAIRAVLTLHDAPPAGKPS
jgi:hypothetical protein